MSKCSKKKKLFGLSHCLKFSAFISTRDTKERGDKARKGFKD